MNSGGAKILHPRPRPLRLSRPLPVIGFAVVLDAVWFTVGRNVDDVDVDLVVDERAVLVADEARTP